MDCFDDYLFGLTPLEVASRVAYGNFDPSHDDYFRFNIYGHLESATECSVERDILDSADEIIEQALENWDDIKSNLDDEVLTSILLEMSREDSLYNIFTDEQKCVLLGNPYGNLYTTSEAGVVVRSPIDIAVDLYKETYGKDITIDEENGLDVVRGLREFLLTADIDQSVSEKSDDYVLDMYRNNESRDVDSITIDNKHDYLRAYMSEFAPDYGEDDYKKTL